MVAQGVADLSFENAALSPLLATAPIPSAKLFPIPSWRPRDGRNDSYDKWLRAVRQLLAAFDITEERLEEQPPAPIVSSSMIVTRQDDEESAKALADERALEIANWQRVNTAIYWHVVPSLRLSGVHEKHDMNTIDGLVRGQRAHGRALILWAMSHASMASPGIQHDLWKTIHGARLQPGATVVHLLTHMQHMYDHWIHLAGSQPNNETSFIDYHRALLASLAGAKDGSPLQQVKFWLANEASKQSNGLPHLLGTYEIMRAAIEKQAAIFGVPPGEDKGTFKLQLLGEPAPMTINVLVSIKDLSPTEDDSLDDSLNAMGAGRKPGQGGNPGGGKPGKSDKLLFKKGDNDCSVCDSFGCQSNQKGGPKFCICLSSSTASLARFSRNIARYCHGASVLQGQPRQVPQRRPLSHSV